MAQNQIEMSQATIAVLASLRIEAERFQNAGGKKPLGIYLGQYEYNRLSDYIIAKNINNVDAPKRYFIGLEVFKLEASRHLRIV